ncbi:hypothetical protein KY314_03255 [Candidatus Woesearchaeota archaeon]|nr:hypothetical protein [Candidatus Woesearchaeota archaeon]
MEEKDSGIIQLECPWAYHLIKAQNPKTKKIIKRMAYTWDDATTIIGHLEKKKYKIIFYKTLSPAEYRKFKKKYGKKNT